MPEADEDAALRSRVRQLKAEDRNVSEIAVKLKIGRAKVRELLYGTAS